MSTLTSSYNYSLPARPRITIFDREGNTQYSQFDGFNSPANDINVVGVDVERAKNETGSFNILIQDPNNTVAKDHLRFCRFRIEFGKTSTTYKPFFIGFSDIFDTNRPQTGVNEYILSGPSTKVQAAQLMLLIRRATDKVNNPEFGIGNQLIDMAVKRRSRPLNDQDIEEITGWTIDLVSNGGDIADGTNSIFLPVINEVFSTFWDYIERMAAISGANWDVDYSGSWKENLTLRFPSTLHSGITIKSGDQKNPTDQGTKVCYIDSGFSIEDNATSDAGVYTRLYTTTVIAQEVISSSMTNAGSVDLVSKAIAQQAKIENDQRRITDLAFILSKVGEPTSPKDRVNGDIVMDGGDDTPTGRVLATFNIPISSIKSTPDTIFVNDVDVKVRFLEGTNKIWIRLFQRSGIDGSPNSDTANTIRWHHNGVFATTQDVFSGQSTGPTAGDYKQKDTMTWAVANQGPVFTYEIFSKINRLIAVSNPTQAKLIGLKEGYVDTSFLKDFASVNRYMNLLLMKTSKARRSISSMRVTLPDNFVFKPFQIVSFNDGLSGESQDLEVQRARISFSALDSTTGPIGALGQELTLMGLFNPLIGSCNCL